MSNGAATGVGVLYVLYCIVDCVLHALHNITQGLQCKQTGAGVKTGDLRLQRITKHHHKPHVLVNIEMI
jgi:hypothetical protein